MNSKLRLHEHLVNGGWIERHGQTYRLVIPPTKADAYVDAQLDDYAHELPRHFSNLPPQVLRVRARFSHQTGMGTAGFGFWNHPFARDGAVIAPPCNVWYFYSSPHSDLQLSRGLPGHGFKASMLNSGRMPSGVMVIGSRILNPLLKTPVVSSWLMSIAKSVVKTDEAMLTVDMTEWHQYDLQWLPDSVLFTVDGRELLRSRRSPGNAMGFAAWIDNYRASAGSGHYAFDYVEVSEEQWMDIEIMDRDD